MLTGVLSAQTPAHEIPLNDFVKHSDYLDIKISPNGKHFAARVRENETVFMLVMQVSDGEVVGGVQPGDKNEVSSVHWVSNERLIYTFAEKTRSRDSATETGELFAINYDGKSNTMLAGYRANNQKLGSRVQNGKKDARSTHNLLNVLPNDKKNVLIVEYPWTKNGDYWYDRRETSPIISKLNIFTGKKTKRERIPYSGARVFANDEGFVSFATWSKDSISIKAVYRESKAQPWQDISTTLDIETGSLTPVSINKSGTKIYLKGTVGESRISSLFELNLATRKISKVFDNKHELDYWKTDSNGDPVVGTSYPGNHHYHYSLMNAKSPIIKHHKKLRKAFGDQEVQIETSSLDGTLFLLSVSSGINPGEYYLYNTNTNKAVFLWANFSWIDPRTLAPMKPISLKARDGQELHGYITVPTSDRNRNAMVVMPHGGPHGVRDYPYYNPDVQLLANRGYTVLQINFRGSYGYGALFAEQGYRNWGKTMVYDVIDATRWAINKGHSDKNKVCIYGASYGGYSALMSAVKAPELFQCSIGYVGVYDLRAMKFKGDIPIGFRGRNYLDKVLGSDTADLIEQSPLTHAAKIKAKVMLIHGDEDIRVPSYHSKKMRAALKKAKNPAEWLYLNDAGHGAFSVENRTKVYEGLLNFLNEHIGE